MPVFNLFARHRVGDEIAGQHIGVPGRFGRAGKKQVGQEIHRRKVRPGLPGPKQTRP
jgi:hypothetical protein